MHAIGVEPDGTNINVGCGATDLGALQQTVTRLGLDLGVAFDGDGDRMLAVDERGEALDGDQILAILALALGVDLVAVTVMTNLGFHRLMSERGIRVVTTPVGDRYLLEALHRDGGLLGGEQSGHVVWLGNHVDRRRARGGAPPLPRARRPHAERGGRGDASLPAGEAERARGSPRGSRSRFSTRPTASPRSWPERAASSFARPARSPLSESSRRPKLRRKQGKSVLASPRS